MTKGAVYSAIALEAIFLSWKIYDISQDKYMTKTQKQRSTTKEVSSSVVSVPAGLYGTAIGQALIPVPILGATVGGVVGGMVGNTFGGALGEGVFSIFS
jgi:phage tail tape-measure protein